MKIKISKYEIEIFYKVRSLSPEKRVMDIIDAEVKNLPVNKSKKIAMIKIMRRAEVSKILIDAGLVPKEDLRGNFPDETPYLGLDFCKDWVESHYTF